MKKYHVAVAAEAFAAAVLARMGFEVSVQYGANQPGYDLVAVRSRRVLKINVKGSRGGAWSLLAGYKRGRSWRRAVKAWYDAQSKDIAFFFVSFSTTDFNEMPQMYIAKPGAIARHLLEGRNGKVATCLHIERKFKKGVAKGCTDRIPQSWKVSKTTVTSLSRAA